MIGIYKITNPKGKVYIGQSIDINERFKTYSYLKCKNQTKLYNSAKEAYIYSNYSYSGFVKQLNGNRKNNTNFKYLENE